VVLQVVSEVEALEALEQQLAQQGRLTQAAVVVVAEMLVQVVVVLLAVAVS
jgi:hypothetical protein